MLKKLFPIFVVVLLFSSVWTFADVREIAALADKLNEEENYSKR